MCVCDQSNTTLLSPVCLLLIDASQTSSHTCSSVIKHSVKSLVFESEAGGMCFKMNYESLFSLHPSLSSWLSIIVFQPLHTPLLPLSSPLHLSPLLLSLSLLKLPQFSAPSLSLLPTPIAWLCCLATPPHLQTQTIWRKSLWHPYIHQLIVPVD